MANNKEVRWPLLSWQSTVSDVKFSPSFLKPPTTHPPYSFTLLLRSARKEGSKIKSERDGNNGTEGDGTNRKMSNCEALGNFKVCTEDIYFDRFLFKMGISLWPCPGSTTGLTGG